MLLQRAPRGHGAPLTRGRAWALALRLLLLASVALLAWFGLVRAAADTAAAPTPVSFDDLLEASLANSPEPNLLAVMEAVSFAAEQAVPPNERSTLFDGMGQIYQVPQEVAFYAAAARMPGVRTVCEVGFNAGHSAAVFLLSNPQTSYIGFDLMSLRWSAASLSFMQRAFPGRVTIVRGYSTDTLPQHSAPLCDILSIDGEHAGETPYLDIVNGKKASRAGGLVLMDDWSSTSPDVKAAWKKAKESGLLEEIKCVDEGIFVKQYHKAWCLGRYL